MNERSTQKRLILDYLKQGKRITPLIAAQSPFNSLRLSERIRELRADGHAVQKEMIQVPSGKRVMSYWLSRAG